MNKFIVTNQDLLEITEKFCEATKQDKSWERLPYQEWRAFDKYLAHFSYQHEFSVIENCNILSISPIGDDEDKFQFVLNNSKNFASYLLLSLKNYLLEADEVTYTTNTISTNNYNNNITTTNMPTYTTSSYTYTTNPSIQVGKVCIEEDKITINGKKVLTEEDPMTTKDFGMNFKFGPVTDNNIAVCPFGVAAKNPDGGYVYYDPEACEVKDCTPFTFDTKKFLFAMPVAVSAINEGDVIMHRGAPMFVKGIEDNEGRVVVIDIAEGEEKYILPTKNMFGFNFVTKIVSLLDMKNSGADATNPFGNMLPLLMMQDGKDLDPMLFLIMSGQNRNMVNLPQNPLMMYMLMSGKKDMLPFLLMNCMGQK